jgi:hypothetical protein
MTGRPFGRACMFGFFSRSITPAVVTSALSGSAPPPSQPRAPEINRRKRLSAELEGLVRQGRSY